MAAAWANASPTSRKVTSRNGGGRSSAGFDDVRRRMRSSGGISTPRLAKVVCNDYNLMCHGARARSGDEMPDRPPKIVICSCEDTMPLDVGAVKRGCRGSEVLTAHQLCRAELDKFRKAAGEPLIVGCTQEAPLFSEVAQESLKDAAADVTYANIRETAGWSADASAAGPKMAALLAAAAEPTPEIPFVSLTSEGVILIYGRDERAIEAANLLKDHLDVTVLIKPPADVAPPRVTDFPVVKGLIRTAEGHLGAFELTVDNYAQPAPSSRDKLTFFSSRDGAVSKCDLVLDLSGSAPLFTASDLRDGYL